MRMGVITTSWSTWSSSASASRRSWPSPWPSMRSGRPSEPRRASVCDAQLDSGSDDLWGVEFDYGPERNLELWIQAQKMLDHLVYMANESHNDGLVVALGEAYTRASEQVKRSEEELEMHR